MKCAEQNLMQDTQGLWNYVIFCLLWSLTLNLPWMVLEAEQKAGVCIFFLLIPLGMSKH